MSFITRNVHKTCRHLSRANLLTRSYGSVPRPTRVYPARASASKPTVAKATASTTTSQLDGADPPSSPNNNTAPTAEEVRETFVQTSPAESLPATPFVGVSENGFTGDLINGDGKANDWSKSYYGLSSEAFSKEIADVLLAPLDEMDIEMKPDGLIYLPEIKYRRILNKAFGPGAWGLAPRTETNVGPKIVSREYALVCQGRLVAIARGENEYFDPAGIPTAAEGCKSNALMRCCKDLGIASELWDPRFIRQFKAKHCVEIFAENVTTKKTRKLWRRKDQPKFDYPWKE